MINYKPASCRYLLLVVLFAVLIGIALGLALALSTPVHAQVSCPQVCPPCNVKAEWTGNAYEYEYTDGTATITGTTPISVCWQAASSYQVSSVCIKAGQGVFWPEPTEGCWSAGKHDISHIVVCTEKSTAIQLVTFQASRLPDFGLVLFLIGVAGMAFGLYVIVRTRREDG